MCKSTVSDRASAIADAYVEENAGLLFWLLNQYVLRYSGLGDRRSVPWSTDARKTRVEYFPSSASAADSAGELAADAAARFVAMWRNSVARNDLQPTRRNFATCCRSAAIGAVRSVVPYGNSNTRPYDDAMANRGSAKGRYTHATDEDYDSLDEKDLERRLAQREGRTECVGCDELSAVLKEMCEDDREYTVVYSTLIGMDQDTIAAICQVTGRTIRNQLSKWRLRWRQVIDLQQWIAVRLDQQRSTEVIFGTFGWFDIRECFLHRVRAVDGRVDGGIRPLQSPGVAEPSRRTRREGTSEPIAWLIPDVKPHVPSPAPQSIWDAARCREVEASREQRQLERNRKSRRAWGCLS